MGMKRKSESECTVICLKTNNNNGDDDIDDNEDDAIFKQGSHLSYTKLPF